MGRRTGRIVLGHHPSLQSLPAPLRHTAPPTAQPKRAHPNDNGADVSTSIVSIAALRNDLRSIFAERDELIDLALIALITQQHIVMLGPVGTGKSMLANEVCKRVEGATLFQWLLTRFSTPEEVFGPISLAALEQDRYERITTGKLPEAHIAFIDEIFKANSAILNTMLSVMNERVFHSGSGTIPIPLVSIFAASNELPEDGELGALFDRFLLRYVVDYIHDDANFVRMLTAAGTDGGGAGSTSFTLDDLAQWRALSMALPIADAVIGDLVAVRRQLRDAGIEPSDRRFRACLQVLRAFAWIEGADRVDAKHLRVLEHVLWNDPDERETVRATIADTVERFERRAERCVEAADEVMRNARRRRELPSEVLASQMEALSKLTQVRGELHDLIEEASVSHRLSERLQSASDHVASLLSDVLTNIQPSK